MWTRWLFWPLLDPSSNNPSILSRFPRGNLLGSSHELAVQRLRTTLDLFEAGYEMKRMALRRDHPGLEPDEENRLLGEWLRDKEIPLADVRGYRVRERHS